MRTKRREQTELEGSELNVQVADVTPRRRPVDREVAIGVRSCSRTGRPARPAEQRLTRASELLLPERLDDVVVGAGLEAPHPLELVAAGGEHQDGHVATCRGSARGRSSRRARASRRRGRRDPGARRGTPGAPRGRSARAHRDAPARSSRVPTRARMSSSSSMTSTRESLIPLSYHGHPTFNSRIGRKLRPWRPS